MTLSPSHFQPCYGDTDQPSTDAGQFDPVGYGYRGISVPGQVAANQPHNLERGGSASPPLRHHLFDGRGKSKPEGQHSEGQPKVAVFETSGHATECANIHRPAPLNGE